MFGIWHNMLPKLLENLDGAYRMQRPRPTGASAFMPPVVTNQGATRDGHILPD